MNLKIDLGKEKKELLKYALLFTFILGLIAHGFGFLNLNPSHDALHDFFSDDYSLTWQISLGRVLEPLYRLITGSTIVMPWLAGILSVVWIGLSVYFTSRIFNVSGKLEVFIISGIFVTNKTVIALTASYMPWMGADMFALLLSVLAVYFWRNFIETSKKKELLLGSVCLMAALGLYQSYVAVTIFLIIVCCMLMLLEHKPAKAVMCAGIKSIVMIVIGGGLYFILLKFICSVFHISLQSGYNSVTNLWSNSEPIYARFIWAYRQVIEQFTTKSSSIYPQFVLIVVNIILLLSCLAEIVYFLSKNKITKVNILLLVVLTMLIPLGVNIIRVLNSDTHSLMYYAIYLIYLLPILLVQFYLKQSSNKIKKLYQFSYILLLFIIFTNIQTANLVYTEKQVQYNSTLSTMTIVVHDIENQEGYIPGETPVIFVGTPGDALTELPSKKHIQNITGVEENSAITYDFESYFENVLQKEIRIEDVEEKNVNEIKALPAYPEKGYITWIDGKLIVKFGDE